MLIARATLAKRHRCWTIIMLILLALVVLVIVAWWLFEIDLPDVVVAGTAPAAGACIVYRHAALGSSA
ncbi:MAG: hypothetical protein ACAH04_01465 [Methylibium sp.]